MAAAADLERGGLVERGAHVALLGRHLGEARLAIQLRKRGGHLAERALVGGDRGGQLGEHLLLEAERAIGRGDDAALGLHQLGRGEADGAGHGLAMPEGVRQGLAQQSLRLCVRHLDVEAQDVVVAHLEGPDAGLLQVLGLQRRHHLAAVVAQRAGLVEIGAETRSHEAAVAALMRGIVDQRTGEQVGKVAPASRQASGDVGERLRQADAAGAVTQQTRACRGRRQPVAHGSQVARASALQGEAGDGPRDVGRSPQRAAQIDAQRLVLAQEGDRIETRGDRDRIAQGARQPGRQLARAGAGRRAIDGKQQAALPLARERAQQLQAGAACGIDDETVGGPRAARGTQARHLADLRQLHVLEQRADGRQLGARELAEGLQIGDAQPRLEQALAGEAVEGGARHRRGRRAGDADPFAHALVGQQPVGGDHLAGREAHDLARQVGRRHLADLELAGGDVERGQRDRRRVGGARFRTVEQSGQVIARLGVEQAVLGQRAWGDEAHHVAAHHGLGAALAGFRRVLQLLADGDAEAQLDQPLQVFVGAMDRHPAHGDVVAQVLAALGEHDRERLRGGHRVLEEQLVEIAHAVEQQAVGIGRLDLQELGHGRRDAGGRDRRPGGAGARLVAIGRRWRAGAPAWLRARPPFRFPRSRAMSLRLVPNPCGKD